MKRGCSFQTLLVLILFISSSAWAERLSGFIEDSNKKFSNPNQSRGEAGHKAVTVNRDTLERLVDPSRADQSDEIEITFRRDNSKSPSVKIFSLRLPTVDQRGAVYRLGSTADPRELLAIVKYRNAYLLRIFESNAAAAADSVRSYHLKGLIQRNGIPTLTAELIAETSSPQELNDVVRIADSVPAADDQEDAGGTQALLGGATVDVLGVVTELAAQNFGGMLNAELELLLAIAIANAALDNSGVPHRFRLVHVMQVANTGLEVSDTAVALSRLTVPIDGVADQVHSVRNTYGADLVAGVLATAESGTAGRGYLWTSLGTNFASSSFSVTLGQYLSRTLPHELGHNLGANHEPENADGSGMFSYSYGRNGYLDYCNEVSSGCNATWGTIMSYGGDRIWHYSSPNIYIDGFATGTVQQKNNASTFNQSMPVASAWRPTMVSTSPFAGPWMISASSGLPGRIELEWQSDPLATGYLIYRSVSGWEYCPDDEVLTTVTGTSFTDNFALGLAPPLQSDSFYYSVRAVRGSLLSECSPNILLGQSVPVNQFLTATINQFDDRVRLTWNLDGSYWTRVKLYRHSSPRAIGCSGSPLSETVTSVGFSDDTQVVPGQIYYYSAKAKHTTELGPIEFDTYTPCTPLMAGSAAALLAPVAVSASDGTFNDHIHIGWEASNNVDGYLLYRTTLGFPNGCEADPGVTLVNIQNGSAINFDDFSVNLPGVHYKYSLRSYRGSDVSPNCSNVDSGYIDGLIPPATLIATDGGYPNKVGVFWTHVPNMSGYQLFRNGNCSGLPIYTAPNYYTTLYWDYDVSYPNIYTYSVRSVNGTGVSTCSPSDPGWPGLGVRHASHHP